MVNKHAVRQIFIAGAGTGAWWNLGDEAIFASMIDDLRAIFPSALIGVLSSNPQGSLRRYAVQEIPFNDVHQIIHFARESDLFIMGGGGFFFDYWGYGADNLLTSQHTGSGVYIGFTHLAKLLRKPLAFFAIGIGPLSSEVGKKYTHLAFEPATLITVRDNESRDLLASLGISLDRIHVTADPAFRYKEISGAWGSEIIHQMLPGFFDGSPTLGVAVRDWHIKSSPESTRQMIAQVLDRYVEEQAGKVIFLPFHRDTGDQGTDDFQTSKAIHAQMKHVDAAIMIDLETSLDEKISILRNCELILGMRLHANIFAVRYGIPCVGLAYDPKVKNFFESINSPELCLELSTLTPELLWMKLRAAYENRQVVSARFEKIQKNKSELAEKTLFLLSDAVDHFQSPPPVVSEVENLTHALLLEHALRSESQQQEIEELKEQINTISQEVEALRRSFSWKVTLPLRLISRLIRSPRQALLEIARHVWKSLPVSYRDKIKPFLLRLIGGVMAVIQRARGMTPDLTWEQFRSQVLSVRHSYRGVFIQEPVIDWNVPLHQRPQHIATALGKLGYLVIFKTPSFDNIHGVRQVAENVWATNLPVDEIDDMVYSVYSTAYATADAILAEGPHKKGIFVYEYIDHISALISGDNVNVRKLIRLKKFAFKNAAYIIASARQLEQEAINAVGRDKVLYIPNGVDVDHYRNPLHKTTGLPKSLLDFRERYPILVGYFGAIAPWLWYTMLDELVALCPDIGFVFIGPDYQGGVSHLPRTPNLLHLGPVNYGVLPAYGRLFDVCLIPFAPGDIARTTSPLKLFEYFALEKPVVVTSFMDECVAFPEVFSGDSAHAMAKAIDAAVKVKDDPGFRQRLRLLADQNSWDERVRAFEKVFPLVSPCVEK